MYTLTAKNAVRIGLHWPSISTRIFLRKVASLSTLLRKNKDNLCSRTFVSMAIEDIYNTSIIQQCRMLESQLGTDIVAQCLRDPDNAISFVRSSKKNNIIMTKDYDKLISNSISHHPSSRVVAAIAMSSSWR